MLMVSVRSQRVCLGNWLRRSASKSFACACAATDHWHAKASRSSRKPLQVIVTRLSTTCNQAPCAAAGGQEERSAATAVFEETAAEPQTNATLAVGVPPATAVPVTTAGLPAAMVVGAVDTGLQAPAAPTGDLAPAATTSTTAGSSFMLLMSFYRPQCLKAA